jgi:hypothetical protein
LARLDNLEAQVATLQTALADETAARENAEAMLATAVMQHMDLLTHFSRDGDDITITGANLHIVNGTGVTETTNSLGNLIVGYNELRTSGATNDRTGSHMLVVGKDRNYSSYAGIVVGKENTTGGGYSSISGGNRGTASGLYSSVSGGQRNTARGLSSSVSGGTQRMASNIYDWVAGLAFASGVAVTGPR